MAPEDGALTRTRNIKGSRMDSEERVEPKDKDEAHQGQQAMGVIVVLEGEYNEVFRASFLQRLAPRARSLAEEVSKHLGVWSWEVAKPAIASPQEDFQNVLIAFAAELHVARISLEENLEDIFGVGSENTTNLRILDRWLREVRSIEAGVVEVAGPPAGYKSWQAEKLSATLTSLEEVFREAVSELKDFPSCEETAKTGDPDLHALALTSESLREALTGSIESPEEPKRQTVLGIIRRFLSSKPADRNRWLRESRKDLEEDVAQEEKP